VNLRLHLSPKDRDKMDMDKFAGPLLHAIGFAGVVRIDAEAGIVRMRYTARSEFAHSNGAVVQGGFVTAWLDSAMAMAVSARDPESVVATLELKVSFLERVDVSTFEVEARAVRWGGSIVFLEADLFSKDGRLLARASSTGKVLKRPA
jgi:uncharacterized protein (TIGR00369 family)